MNKKEITQRIVIEAVRKAQQETFPTWEKLSELEIVEKLLQLRRNEFHECGVVGGKYPSWIFNTHNYPMEVDGYVFHFHGGLEVMSQILQGNFSEVKAFTYPDWKHYEQGWDEEIFF